LSGSNGFGSARVGSSGKQTGNNKMNSFRGGPVRATVNAIDNTTQNIGQNLQNQPLSTTGIVVL
jgi:hypothetical protein